MRKRSGPLAGLKVIEFAGLGPGPFCGMLLADLGAEVVQIDRPGGAMAAFAVSDHRRNILNRGKRSVVLDLKKSEELEIALKLVDRADGVIEANRAGVAERLGIGPDVCLARNPRLVYGRVTGWGQTGPLADWAGHDINYIALAGALHVCGREGETPAIPQNFVADMGGGGLYLAFGMLAALLEARQSGKGQVVDAAMIEGVALQLSAVLALRAFGAIDDRRGTGPIGGGAHFYEVYETKDGQHLAVGAIEPQFYRTFLKEAGLDDPIFEAQWDRARWPMLKEQVAARLKERTRDDWVATFSSEACVAPVLSLAEVDQHPHMAARGVFFHDGEVMQPAPGPRFSRTPGAVSAPPSRPGEDTQDVLRDWGIPI